jgi:outer membrane biosynthesis protein TonB
MEKENKDRLRGIAGTALFHGLLLLLFLFFGFRTPLPLPAEQGIAINFGDAPDGTGDMQPEQTADNQQANEPTSAPSSSSSSSAERSVMTQETEDAPVIKPVTKPTESKKPTEETKKPTETPVEDPKPKVDPRALYPGSGSGSAGGSQGQTGKPGDQGNPDGSRDVNRQGDGSRGGNNGSPEFKLEGRQITQRPTLTDRSQVEGQVVVWIWVDKAGRVTRTQAGANGTTLQNEAIWRKCEEAARNARFSANENSPEEQRGTLTFIFKLQ